MGNCQVTETSAAIVQHQGGRVERMYWPTSSAEVMRNNPGHHVAVVTLCTISDESHSETAAGNGAGGGGAAVSFTRVRLLKPRDMLVLGQVYRLVTTQEVNKALQARKHEKMKRARAELIKRQQQEQEQRRRDDQSAGVGKEEAKLNDPQKVVVQVATQAPGRQRSALQPPVTRARHWRPSLQSIKETGS